MTVMPLEQRGISTSRLVLGCMPFGGGWNDVPITNEDVRSAEKAVDAALAIGISMFDHADIYARGKAEETFGTILKNRPAGNAFEDAILQANQYERNTAMMMPPPGSGAQGFVPDSVKDNPTELIWGQPYAFVESKARKELSLSGNLKAMIGYVDKYGGHLELWVRSGKHPDGATRLSGTLLRSLERLEAEGKAVLRPYP